MVAYIKQALKEYAEESCGFWIMPTVDVGLVGGVNFSSKYAYDTLKSIVKEKGLVVVSGQSKFQVMFIPDTFGTDTEYVFICNSTQYDPSKYTFCPVTLYGVDTWAKYKFQTYQMMGFSGSYSSWDDFKSSATAGSGVWQSVSDFRILHEGQSLDIGSSLGNFYVVSKDGRRVQVYKSLDAYKYADTSTRPVYFGSKFWEDSGSVEASFDDLQGWLDGKYEDFWERLEDLIPPGSSLTEEDLEKIIDGLLDKLDDIGGDIGDISGEAKETNSWLEKIYNRLDFSWAGRIYDKLGELDRTVAAALSGAGASVDLSAVEGYLATIVAQLDVISGRLEEMGEEEFSEKTDGLFGELAAAGAEIGEAAKTKFPLSIPWDVSSMLDRLGGSSSPAPARAAPASYSPGGFVSVYASDPLDPDGNGDHGGGGGGSGGGGSGGGGHDRGGAFLSASGAPVFVLPLVFSESMGIEGTVYVDMSDFIAVSRISRALFTLLFAYGLVNLTFKAVALGKDVFD